MYLAFLCYPFYSHIDTTTHRVVADAVPTEYKEMLLNNVKRDKRKFESLNIYTADFIVFFLSLILLSVNR